MSGLNGVFATASGNLSCFPRSTPSSQSCGVANRPEEVFQESAADFYPALVIAMAFLAEGSRCGRWYGMDGIHSGPQEDLVVWPAVASFLPGLLDSSLGGAPRFLSSGRGVSSWCLHLTPGEEVGWSLQHMVDHLDQE